MTAIPDCRAEAQPAAFDQGGSGGSPVRSAWGDSRMKPVNGVCMSRIRNSAPPAHIATSTSEQTEALVASLDRNADGVIDYEEFLHALETRDMMQR